MSKPYRFHGFSLNPDNADEREIIAKFERIKAYGGAVTSYIKELIVADLSGERSDALEQINARLARIERELRNGVTARPARSGDDDDAGDVASALFNMDT